MKYSAIRNLVYGRPWAIMPPVLESIGDILEARINGVDLMAEFKGSPAQKAAQDIQAARDERVASQSGGAIMVIPVYGIIEHRARMVDDVSSPGGTSTEAVGKLIDGAINDDRVRAIVLDIDSPGGSVMGVQELAEKIRVARQSKPIVASANGMAASAAYWIGSAASEFTVTPSGQVGSIGVYALHEDVSAALENAGRKVTLVKAGKYKTEGNPYEQLDDEARGDLQSHIDGYYAAFVGDVAAGRGVSRSTVVNDYGEGRVLMAKAARAVGMVDRVETFEDTLARVARNPGRIKKPGKAAAAMGEELEASHNDDGLRGLEEIPQGATAEYDKRPAALMSASNELNEMGESVGVEDDAAPANLADDDEAPAEHNISRPTHALQLDVVERMIDTDTPADAGTD